VSAGGIASGTQVSGGSGLTGGATVSSGGSALSATVGSGGIKVLSGGVTISTTLIGVSGPSGSTVDSGTEVLSGVPRKIH
jgi:hypothetical protein